MKKTGIILLTIAVSIAAASCQRDSAPGNCSGAGRQITITAGIENDGAILIDGEEYIPETKTARQEDGKVWWTPGDAISLFFGPNDIMGGNKFLSTAKSPEAVTSFTGSMGAATGGGEGVSLDDFSFWAVYPYNKSNACDGRSVTLAIPTEQESAKGNFGAGQWPTVGHSSGLLLSFNNVVAGYKFMVETEGIIKVVIRTPNTAHPLSGLIKVGMDSSGKPVIKSVLFPSNEVVVTPEDGGAFVPGKYYYAAVIHNYLDAGVSFDFYTSNSVASYNCVMTGDKPERPSKRGAFKLMDNKDHGLTWTRLIPPENSLPDGETFNSHMVSLAGSLDNIKWIHFYSDQTNPEDGIRIADDVYMRYVEWGIEVKTSMSQFVADVDCSGMFAGCKNVVTIEGLEKVNTSATTDMSGMFDGCSKLEVVTLTGDFTTAKVTKMTGMFDSCESLEKLDLSNFNTAKATNMNYMFEGCTALKEVYLGGDFVIPAYCSVYKALWECSATWYGATEEMKSFISNLLVNSDYRPGALKFAIDMGEAGWWSAWNMGADRPEEYGDYYAWGETEFHYEPGYAQENPQEHWKKFGQGTNSVDYWYRYLMYKWYDSSDGGHFTKYCFEGPSPDYKSVLEKEDDAAAQNWGGKWRMPTPAEWNYLMKNCSLTWIDNYGGTSGRMVTSSNGNSIFLPAAGYRSADMLFGLGENGRYWTTFYATEKTSFAVVVELDDFSVHNYSRYAGFSVRPVSDEKE